MQMSLHLNVCVCLVEGLKGQTDSLWLFQGVFPSQTGEAAALLWFPLELQSNGGNVRTRGGVSLIKVTHCLHFSHIYKHRHTHTCMY